MENGFEFELTNGTVIQFVPTRGATTCAVSHGDTRIEINPQNWAFRVSAPAGKPLSAIPHIVRAEPKSLLVSDIVEAETAIGVTHAMRACVNCGGYWCCVTGGCVNCGCGWVCGAEP